MIELLKNKVLLLFIVFVLGAIYIDSVNVKNLNENEEQVVHEQLIVNK